MQSFIVVTSLVSDLAGGQNDPLVLYVTKNTLVLKVTLISTKKSRGQVHLIIG